MEISREIESGAASLSGGERQRIKLAAQLGKERAIIVLDEPTVGLDPVTREEIWTHLRTLADDGVTLLVSSHVMDEATRCDRLILLREGEILSDSTLAELLARIAGEIRAYKSLVAARLRGETAHDDVTAAAALAAADAAPTH